MNSKQRTSVITESDISASYLDILLTIDSNGRLTTTLYDKRDDFINFSFLYTCSNIPLSSVYGVYSMSPGWFDTQERVLRMKTFQSESNYWQKSSCCRVITNLVWSHQILRSLLWPCLRLQIITGPYAEWFNSYRSVDCRFHTGFDNG
jgi:hypothetical protein